MQKIKTLLIIFFILLLSISFISPAVHAEQVNSVKDCLENPDECGSGEANADGKSQKRSDVENGMAGVGIWDFIKMILATVFVVVLIYFLFKFLNKKNREYQHTALMQNLGGIKVGANRSVQIIKIGDRVFIIGVGENVNLIKELNSEDVQLLLTKYNDYLENLAGPGDIFSRLLQRKEEMKRKEDKPVFSTVLDEQFEDMNKKRKEVYEEITKKGPRDNE